MVPQFSSAISISADLCVCLIGRIIDNKTLRLITETSESSPSKSDRDYMDSGLRGICFLLVLVNIFSADYSLHSLFSIFS